MQKELKLIVIALCFPFVAYAQKPVTTEEVKDASADDDAAFTFTEAQLGEDDDMSQNVSIISSNQNIYASQAGYLFSPVRFRFRAYNQKYNEVFINGAPMNDLESGQFRFSPHSEVTENSGG